MFFTQEDYLKIQQWLQRNSVKDTEFQEADMPFAGNEIITIIQNGHNKKLYLKDFVDQIFSLGITDFINVSALYDNYNLTLEEAIKLVPHKARKKGQMITFSGVDGWETYQFIGALNQWNFTDTWIKKY